jgi:protease II
MRARASPCRWGNPAEPECYDYMKSYSPTDNVTAQE